MAGLMSGTSLDGVDVVLAYLDGSGKDIRTEILAFDMVPYPADLVRRLMANSIPNTSSVKDISQLNVRLAHVYADAVKRVAGEAGIAVDSIDLIGSHGQTIHHVPVAEDVAGQEITSTLQIGDPSVLANLTNIPVVGDFRLADMALGGQGAPLVPYFDYIQFSSDDETRALLNLGGIANITVLPRGGSASDVIAFDTGPANMVIDGLAQEFLNQPFDRGGAFAASGSVDDDFLADLLMQDTYLSVAPPKSTGREHYNPTYVRALLEQGRSRNLSDRDIMATASTFTAYAVYQAYARFIRDNHTADVLIVAGGGRHNDFIMSKLRASFAPIEVVPIDDFGMQADLKEALCFAVLAHETANGVPTSMPSVTGASRPAILGKLCYP